MASIGDSSCLWSPDNKDGQTIVSEHDSYHDLLTDNLMTILKLLELTDSFWALLIECGVMDENLKGKMQKKKTRQAQVLGLMDHIMNSEVYKFHGFAWAIVNTKQYNLAKELGFELSVYLSETLFLKSSSFLCPSCCEFYTKAYILPECGHYVCSPCVKGAQFLCKENQKEDITCPVPDCGKVSQTNDKLGRDIGLEEDERYAKLCQLVESQAEELKKKKDSVVEAKENNNDALDSPLKKAKFDLSTYEQTYRTYLDTVSDAEPRLKAYLEMMHNKVINWIKQWHSEKEEFMHESKFQVQTRHAQSVQWEKIFDDLLVMSRIYPWTLEKISSEIVETASFKLAGATPDIVGYAEQLVSGTMIPQNIWLPKNLNIHAATKHPLAIDTADFLFQWKNHREMLLDVDWTNAGNIVTGTSKLFIRLTLDLDSQSIVHNHEEHENSLTTVSTSVDDMIYLCCKQSVNVFNPRMMCWENWGQSLRFYPIRLAGGHKHVVATTDSYFSVYNKQRIQLKSFYLTGIGNICICKNILVAIGNGVHLINLDTNEQLQVPLGTEGEGRLVSPFDVAPFGEDHFLVYDQALQAFKVFNLAGEFILKLKVNNLAGEFILKLKVNNMVRPVTPRPTYPRHIATFPKKGTPTHLAVVSNTTLQIFFLT